MKDKIIEVLKANRAISCKNYSIPSKGKFIIISEEWIENIATEIEQSLVSTGGKTAEEFIKPLIWSDEMVMDTVGEGIRFVSANDAITAMKDYTKQFDALQRSGYEREFIWWLFSDCARIFERFVMFDTKPNYSEFVWYDFQTDKDFTLDELHQYWQTEIKGK
jgi:hypothetical protein